MGYEELQKMWQNRKANQELSREQRWSLKGMTDLITGGTKGIGYAIVEELAGFGAAIHTCSRNQTELNERLKEWGPRCMKSLVQFATCHQDHRGVEKMKPKENQ